MVNWVIAAAHASVQVAVDMRGDVVGVYPGDVVFEVCGAPVQGGPAVRSYQMTQALTPFQSRASSRKISQTPCPP